jgi:hypothetical protein
MTQINPFTGANIMGSAVQQRQGVDKERQLRRLQNLSRNTALQGEDMDHQVESANAPHATDDGDGSSPQQQHHKKMDDDDQPHIDLKA